MMRKLGTIIVAALVVALLPVAAGAITNGEVDAGDEYSFVGMLAFYDEGGDYLWRCTGTLVSETVMVTASHCTEETNSARAYFDVEVTASYPDGVGGTTGQTYLHPDYNPRTLANDVGVVVLDEAAPVGGPYPTLPGEWMLSTLKRTRDIHDDVFVAAGYGGQNSWPPSTLEFDLFRRVARSPYQGLTQNNLHLNQNPEATGAGGTCFGDSGGPRFWENTDTLVAVTSWGDAICRANDMAQRLDIPSARDWVLSFLGD
jgi:hypothetical protein